MILIQNHAMSCDFNFVHTWGFMDETTKYHVGTLGQNIPLGFTSWPRSRGFQNRVITNQEQWTIIIHKMRTTVVISCKDSWSSLANNFFFLLRSWRHIAQIFLLPACCHFRFFLSKLVKRLMERLINWSSKLSLNVVWPRIPNSYLSWVKHSISRRERITRRSNS